jgi:hypothetical protein
MELGSVRKTKAFFIRLVPQPKTSHDRLVQKPNLRRLGVLGRQKTGFFTICPLNLQVVEQVEYISEIFFLEKLQLW